MACFPQQLGKLSGPFRIKCQLCGHEAEWTIAHAVKLLGYSTGPMQARDKLKCSECGGKRMEFR